MNDDERALLQAQATIYAGLLVSLAIYRADPRNSGQDDVGETGMMDAARRYAHQLAQNLDLGSGKP